MRKSLPIILLFALVPVCMSGCQSETRKALRQMMGSTIVLPDNVICIHNGEVFPMPEEFREGNKMVFYTDSSNCTECLLSHLYLYEPFFNLSNENESFSTIILLSTKNGEAEKVIQYLNYREYHYPIYIDVDNSFLAINQYIPKDDRFHSIFIADSGKPLLVGMTMNERGIEILKELISQINKP